MTMLYLQQLPTESQYSWLGQSDWTVQRRDSQERAVSHTT